MAVLVLLRVIQFTLAQSVLCIQKVRSINRAMKTKLEDVIPLSFSPDVLLDSSLSLDFVHLYHHLLVLSLIQTWKQMIRTAIQRQAKQ